MSGKSHQKYEKMDSVKGEHSLPLYRKLLLSAVMTGSDMCTSFEQLYMLPLLQILGVPVTFVSLAPAVTGPVTMILMNLFGYCSDKGPRHRFKKLAVVAVSSSLILCGMFVLIGANLLLSRSGTDAASTADKEKKNMEYSPQIYPHYRFRNWTELSRKIWRGNNSEIMAEDDTGMLSLPVTAIMGLVGFSLMALGYDLNISASRSCILVHTPQRDHTNILVLGLVMAAAGGCFNSLLGMLDLSAVFDTGDRMASQTMVQLIACSIVLVISSTSTVLTALYSKEDSDGQSYSRLKEDIRDVKKKKAYKSIQPVDKLDSDGEENQGYDTHSQSNSQQNSENDSDEVLSGSCDCCSVGDVHGHDVEEIDSYCSGQSCSGRSCSGQSCSGHSQSHQPKLEQKNVSPKQNECGWDLTKQPSKKLNKHKYNFAIACITCYLGSSVTFSYNMFVSDFLGKAVMGGDSSRKAGSAELQAYEDAMSTAALGLFIFFSCYMAIGLIHNKLLNFWGLKMDFVLSHSLMAAAILSLTLTKHVGAFYVCCVVFGFQRSALFSVPFIIASVDAKQEGRDESCVGKTMAIMACMVSLNYCTVCLLSGPLITLTGNVGAPLLMASLSSFLAALTLLLYDP
ncbi:hypothetical protein ACOMHN_026158 [Nucella lapillus]